jgi:hypothetical protein
MVAPLWRAAALARRQPARRPARSPARVSQTICWTPPWRKLVPNILRYIGAVIAAIEHGEFIRIACANLLLQG